MQQESQTIRKVLKSLRTGNRKTSAMPEVDFTAENAVEFETQIKSWRGKLGEEVESTFNPENTKYFSSNALSESRKAKAERRKLEREAKLAEKPKPKPRASKKP